MFTMNSEQIYIPYKRNGPETLKGGIGYVISNSQKECRDRFAELMSTKWKDLYKQGWRIVPCEVCADEYQVFPKEFQH